MASKFLQLPDGSYTKPYAIVRVGITERGVNVIGSNEQIIAFFDLNSNDELKQRVADVITECASAGAKFVQPEWETVFAEFLAS